MLYQLSYTPNYHQTIYHIYFYIFNYLISLKITYFRTTGSYFLYSSRSGCSRLLLVIVYLYPVPAVLSNFTITLLLLPAITIPIYSIISVTTPAPTVCPPSLIAKRNSLSIAIGVINSTLKSTLSPGITISVPSGNVPTPVTSVVRK